MEHWSKKKKVCKEWGWGRKKVVPLGWLTGVSIPGGGSCWLRSSGCYVRSLSSAGCCLQGRTAVQRPLVLWAAGAALRQWLLQGPDGSPAFLGIFTAGSHFIGSEMRISNS